MDESQKGDYHTECSEEFFGGLQSILGEDFVVREQSCEADFAPLLEAVVLRLARRAMILTIPSSLVRLEGGRICYAFKPSKDAENLEQLVSSLEGCEFDGSVEMIAEIIEDFSSIARLDIVNLFEQVIFLWIMGCNSVELNSFALLHPNPGVSFLAPLSPLKPNLQLADNTTQCEFTLTVGGKRSKISRLDFETAMRYMDLKDRIIRITIEKMISAKEPWFETIEASPLSSTLKEQFCKLISVRLSTLQRVSGRRK